jgi:malate dehydrogenase (oxaloacetate-decarboxylating)(NADP+)
MTETSLDPLEYHSRDGRPGKISVTPTKPLETQQDLSMAYTPGVATPVLEIANNPDDVYKYTDKGNLVAVISNGTAILGLGNRGALASKPVMEGKGVLFKRFADIDVFDIEITPTDPQQVIAVVEAMAPTFGGINLEDIKSPECFEIERELIKRLDIPVFHDDQHGTAIILSAAVLNALEITGKNAKDVKVVFSGSGAAGIACAKQLLNLGVPRENLWMTDIGGLVYEGRTEAMFPEKTQFAQGNHPASLRDVIAGADIFIGLSVADIVDEEMLKSMTSNPIIFAMANPNPEVKYEIAKATRPDALVATGRSDYPNQINNVLGFPFIFRGALDVRAKTINNEMKVAASRALAALAKEPVAASVLKAYNLHELSFGVDYIVPKPLDPRACLWVAPAVAKAAMDSGVAQIELNLDMYVDQLRKRMNILD